MQLLKKTHPVLRLYSDARLTSVIWTLHVHSMKDIFTHTCCHPLRVWSQPSCKSQLVSSFFLTLPPLTALSTSTYKSLLHAFATGCVQSQCGNACIILRANSNIDIHNAHPASLWPMSCDGIPRILKSCLDCVLLCTIQYQRMAGHDSHIGDTEIHYGCNTCDARSHHTHSSVTGSGFWAQMQALLTSAKVRHRNCINHTLTVCNRLHFTQHSALCRHFGRGFHAQGALYKICVRTDATACLRR